MFNLFSQTNIIPLLLHYGYLIFLPLAIIEGPITTIIGAFLASLGYFDFLIIYLLAIAGDVIGDTIYYFIGYWGGKKISNKNKFMMIKIKTLKKVQSHFQRHPMKILLLGKWGHSIGAPVLLAGGMSHMPFKKFMLFNFLGTLPKVLAFAIIGYYFGKAYIKINKYFDYFSILILVLFGILIYLLIRKNKFDWD